MRLWSARRLSSDPVPKLCQSRRLLGQSALAKKKSVCTSSVTVQTSSVRPIRTLYPSARADRCIPPVDTNLLLMPGAYTDEFNMKLEFQQRAMEAKLVELGYRQIMAECRELHEAIVDANPAFARLGDNERKQHGVAAWNQCFGALQKYSNGVGVIMAMAKRASSCPYDTLIVSSGTEEISSFGVASNATYLVSGIRDSDKSIRFGSDSFRVDPISGLRVGVSRPPQTFEAGTSAPRARVGHLSRTVRIVVYETNESWNHMDNTKSGGGYFMYEIVVSSAIIGVAGSGHLCLGYPSTSTFSVPTSPEESTTQLRTYLGACITQTENMLIIPNCFVEGISKRVKGFPREKVGDDDYGQDATTPPSTGTKAFFATKKTDDSADVKYGEMYTHDAATFDTNGKMKTPNMGPLGNLDRPHGGLGSITAGIVVRKMD